VFSNHSVAIGSSEMLDDKYPVDDGWGHQPDDNNKPNFLQYEDAVEDNSCDSWWLEAIKVVEDVENKQTTAELSTKVSLYQFCFPMLQFTVKWSLGSVYLYLKMVLKPHPLYLDSRRECVFKYIR
jgi:hypothetical protein